jgi:DnaJ-class molecular chaperone
VKDYYSILGVARTATDEEIKKAYRRLASQHHPDKGGDKAQFQAVQEAYSVLSDSQRRQDYDNPRSQAHFAAGPGFNFDDIFGMFGVNMRQHQARSPRLNIWIGLEDVARGGARVIALQMNNTVSNVEINIPVGITDGDTIRYPQLSPDGGDLVITFRVKPDARWHRDGRNLTVDQEVVIWDLILGTDITLRDIIGTELRLTIPPRTQPGSLLRLRGRGLPSSSMPGRHGGPAGDLLVRVQARIPNDIDQEIIDAIRLSQKQ